jgi:hypothetical protein
VHLDVESRALEPAGNEPGDLRLSGSAWDQIRVRRVNCHQFGGQRRDLVVRNCHSGRFLVVGDCDPSTKPWLMEWSSDVVTNVK